MQSTPHAPDALILTRHVPPTLDLLIRLPACLLQYLRLAQHLPIQQIPYADSPARSIDVVSPDHGMMIGPRRDVDLNGRSGLRECW